MYRVASFQESLRSRSARVVSLLGVLILSPAVLSAQTTRLTLGNTSITIATPTAADYAAGFKASAIGTTYTIDAISGGSRTVTVRIRAGCSDLGNSKPLGELQWRRADLAIWTSITNTDVLVEQRVQVLNGANDPWTNTIYYRMLLYWATDEPNSYQCDPKITITQTVP